MKLSLKVSEKWLDFLDGLTEVNANDVMWQWMEIYLDKALPVRQSLWVTYTHKKYGEHTHEIMFSEDGTKKLAKAYIPPEVIRIPGEWSFQAFIRQYNTIDPTKYMQSATNKVTFTVSNGLPLDGEGAPVTNATVGALYEQAKAIIESASSCKVFVKTILKNDTNWLKDGAYYKYNILLSEHKLANIVDINVNKKTGTGDDAGYENIIFSYKKYLTGSVAIVLSEPLDIEIIIKGE